MTSPYEKEVYRLCSLYNFGGEFSWDNEFSPGILGIRSREYENSGFLGSLKVVHIEAHTITHNSTACIAAPVVKMVAEQTIQIGIDPKDDVEIYAPEELQLSATHVSFGNVKLLEVPSHAEISCKKLTITNNKLVSRYGAPVRLEIVKSWVKDDTEIEVVRS